METGTLIFEFFVAQRHRKFTGCIMKNNDNWVLTFLARQPESIRSKNQARYRREYYKTLSTDKSKKMFDLLLLKANERNSLEDSEELNSVKHLLRAVDQEKERGNFDPIVIQRETYLEGMLCCGVSPVIETIDTERRLQSRYEYRVRCKTCGSMTTQCTWKRDAKTIWNNPHERTNKTR
jgi:hypothetical protein